MVWISPSPTELAADWIASRRENADDKTVGHLAQFLLSDFPEEEPELTWETIKIVVKSYPEADLFTETETEARKVVGVLAAGPVEDLLSFHGDRYIVKFEAEARLDRRIAWVLAGVWQYQMSDEVWERVKRIITQVAAAPKSG